MISLSQLTKEKLMEEKKSRKYHLSYDVMDCENDFRGDHGLAKEFILVHLYNIGVTHVECPCESTIIFTHNGLFNMVLFGEAMKDCFYFSICRVYKALDSHKEIVKSNENLNRKTQKMWRDIKKNI